MSEKSILVAVADPQALVDITQALGSRWEATSVSTEADALGQLEKRAFDGLLVDFNLGEPDGSELLNQALEKRPETMRFLLASEADLALVAAKVVGTHRILPKPIEPDSLKSTIESAMAPLDSLYNQSGSEPANDVSAKPAIPSVYAEVLKALNSPDVTHQEVGEIIARDSALTTELLALTHSAYLGVPRNLTDPVEAVESLGFQTVKALVMALQFLAEHSNLRPGYLSLEQLWQHSTNIGRIARDLVLFETKDRNLASEALAAGLLHDLGKVVLATNFDDLYGRVHSLARKQPVSLWDIEKEMFGATHGEIGGCLVGMWNMPSSIVETAAFHHEPSKAGHECLTPLAAVHIANVLEHEIGPGNDNLVAPKVDTAFLDQLGLLERLPVWRAAVPYWGVAHRTEMELDGIDQIAAGIPVPSSAPPPRSANQLPASPRSTRTAAVGQPARRSVKRSAHASPFRGWIYAGAAAGLLIVLTLLLRTDLRDTPEVAYARTPASNTVPEFGFSSAPAETSFSSEPSPSPELVPVTPPAPAPEPKAASTADVREQAATVTAATVPQPPAISLPEAASTPAIAPQPQASVTNAPAASAAPKENTPLPDFRLHAIIYTRIPSAIVNGETVIVGDRIGGATVVAIGRTNITLRINGQDKIYSAH